MMVREADLSELTAVLNVLDGAALETEYDRVRAGLTKGQVLVAVGDDDTVLGALLLDGDHIDAIAVRRNRRGRGIGTALVEAACPRRERLIATFDAAVRPFYERLGFRVEPAAEEGRFRGVWLPRE